ncbi:hypothetical protein ACRE_028690 [Hapsidospora chrysogenum ATCC 11550]|uniref:Uncharacterized protein n=1 Tax=Hapsidospora chrysogenum (strain ATCC 11550 / CBS 779.69 / DSM 880 / IAM 14645 / JCM 23072 / IMI 49137) TaxID=857340 RepID=A0A086TA58_HAPC1|nr:hypothetical protein ACRE_028690 [Hapsidospora chrysogenum ATCC 11550]
MYSYTSPSRRGSNTSTSSRQRPRLLRSSATQASVTASNEIQAALVSPNSPHTAAALLSKVAYFPHTCDLGAPMAEPPSHRVSEPIAIQHENQERSISTEMSTPDDSVSGSYISFPNFDEWESPKEEEGGEKETYR